MSSQEEKLSQLVAELQKVESPYLINVPQVVAVLNDEPCFPIMLGMIPWGHQTEIVSRCKSVDEAIFYLRECILEAGAVRHWIIRLRPTYINPIEEQSVTFLNIFRRLRAAWHRKSQKTTMTSGL